MSDCKRRNCVARYRNKFKLNSLDADNSGQILVDSEQIFMFRIIAPIDYFKSQTL